VERVGFHIGLAQLHACLMGYIGFAEGNTNFPMLIRVSMFDGGFAVWKKINLPARITFQC